MKKFFAVILAALALMAATTTVLAMALYDTPYIGNKYRHTFHHRDCDSVDQMNPKNQVPLQTREEAIKKGFRPCGNCRP